MVLLLLAPAAPIAGADLTVMSSFADGVDIRGPGRAGDADPEPAARDHRGPHRRPGRRHGLDRHVHRHGSTIRFDPRSLPLPMGETRLSVQFVSPQGEWREVAQFPLNVSERGSYDKSMLTPALDILLKAQVAEGHAPDDNAPARETFEDLNGQLSLTTEHVRGRFAARTGVQIFGTTFQGETLRFGTEGEGAPKVDLGGYSVDLTRSSVRLPPRRPDLRRPPSPDPGLRQPRHSVRACLGPIADLTLSAAADPRSSARQTSSVSAAASTRCWRARWASSWRRAVPEARGSRRACWTARCSPSPTTTKA